MSDLGLTAYGHGIHAIDSGYVRPRLDAIHLIVEKGRAAFIDTGTTHSVPRMLAALDQLGIRAEAVDYVILTHVHLDHAGGAGMLMGELPNATAIVHPRGAPHMIDPSKVWAATLEVYGVEPAQRLYGEIVPIPRERIVEGTDGSGVSLAGRWLEFIDTPGHAKHHFCVWDSRARALFTGDTFGISYRELDQGERQFIFPSTTPTQFDPPALHASVDKLLGRLPRAVYLTHYSQITDIPPKGEDLHRLIEAHAQIGLRWESTADRTERDAGLARDVEQLAIDEALRVGGDPAQWTRVLDNDIALNAQGIGAWLDFRAKSRK